MDSRTTARTFDTEGNFFAGFLELGNEFSTIVPSDFTPTEEPPTLLRNTTIAVVATSAQLTKAQATKVATRSSRWPPAPTRVRRRTS